MPSKLDPSEYATVRQFLGTRLTALHRTMLDLDTPAFSLFDDDRTRLVVARADAVGLLDRWVREQPEVANRIYLQLPEFLRRASVAESVLTAVIASDLSQFPLDVFNYPALDSRLFVAAPELGLLLDESGLVSVTGLDARPWGLHFGEYAFHYHQLLRRGYRSGVHYSLIESVLRLAEAHSLTARIALDERRLRFADEYVENHEHDYWYGRPLDENELDLLAVVGETFYGDPDGGSSFIHPYAGLSVRWTADGGLKTVEIEEFMPQPEGGEWVLARYLHAIRDTDKGAFVHCDGAVKAFSAATYPQTQADFGHRGKGDHYRKLFRVDGEFPSSVWSELAISWFRGNRLIAEYFGRPG